MAYTKKIELQYLTHERDDIGNDISRWTVLLRPWAEISSTGGREYYAAAQVSSESDMIFRLRYTACIEGRLTSELRIVYKGRAYDVKHIDDIMEQHRELVIRAELHNGGIENEQQHNT